MLEHAIVPVRATKFAEVETGLKTLTITGAASTRPIPPVRRNKN